MNMKAVKLSQVQFLAAFNGLAYMSLILSLVFLFQWIRMFWCGEQDCCLWSFMMVIITSSVETEKNNRDSLFGMLATQAAGI